MLPTARPRACEAARSVARRSPPFAVRTAVAGRGIHCCVTSPFVEGEFVSQTLPFRCCFIHICVVSGTWGQRGREKSPSALTLHTTPSNPFPVLMPGGGVLSALARRHVRRTVVRYTLKYGAQLYTMLLHISVLSNISRGLWARQYRHECLYRWVWATPCGISGHAA